MTARDVAAAPVLSAFSDIVCKTMSSLDLQATLHALPANVAGLVDADVACLYFLDAGADRLQLLAHHGYRALGPEDQELPLDRGLNATAATSGQLQRVDDYWAIQDGDQARTPVIKAEPLRSMIVAPLVGRGRTLGTISAGRRSVRPFSDADVFMLELLGGHAAIAIDNALSYQALNRAREEAETTARRLQLAVDLAQAAGRRLATGIEVALDLAGRVELDEVVQQLLVRAVEAIDAGAGSLSTVDGSKARLIATYSRASTAGTLEAEPPPSQDPLVTSAIEERQPVQELQAGIEGQPELTTLAMPLVLGGDVAGVLAVSRAGLEPFTADEIATLQHIGNVAVLATRNARLLAAAKDSSLAQQKFMNMAAHELRTPLAVIRGYLSMLEDGVFGEPPESWRDAVAIVSGKSHELAHLIDEMLLAARLQAGITPMRQDLVDLCAVVAQAAERAAPRATMLGATIDLRLADQPVSILGDEDGLGRVLDNLINNSLTYSDRPPRIRITVQPGIEPVVEVADRGWGVPPELSEQIFESFFRCDDPSRPYSPGTGLGLAISREIIERHGGRLVLHSSRPGKGSRFRLWLPGAVSEEAAGADAMPVLAAES